MKYSLCELLEKGEESFENKAVGLGMSGPNTACALTTLHAGYAKKEGEELLMQTGRVNYCPQVYDLAHPLNHYLSIHETDELPVNIELPLIERVRTRFEYLPVRWGIIGLNDDTNWSRKRIINWAEENID